jgi:hypothetical protein
MDKGASMGIDERITESENWFERAAKHLPGYRGYKAKELRREADKIQRLYVAERLDACRARLEEVQLDLTRQGKLDALAIIDTAVRRTRTIRDRIQFADYGHAGLFDTTKVGEAELDGIYKFDAQLQDKAREVEEFSGSIKADSPSLRSDIDLLEERLGALDSFFSEREHLITGAGR